MSVSNPRQHAQQSAVAPAVRVAADPRAIRLVLMRGFSLVSGDRSITIPLSAQRVLAFVALRDRPTLRLHVAGTLWMDAPERRAMANLRSALWRLRFPGRSIVDRQGDYLSLQQDVHVDVRELAARSRAMFDASADRSADGFSDLIASGELLPDWYDDWVLIERERLRQLRLHALEQACTYLAAEQRYGEAIEAALAAIADEPLRESAHRLLITVYLAEGNRIEAIRQYQVYADLIRSELDLDPAPEIRDLVSSLLPRPRGRIRGLADGRLMGQRPARPDATKHAGLDTHVMRR
jgi:DNA-binding SARP family transcriptional activator